MQGRLRLRPVRVRAYRRVGEVAYPRDAEGQLSALVHPALDGNDFRVLRPRTPAFARLADGRGVCADAALWGEHAPAGKWRRAWWARWARRGPPLYVFFVNEAAYYEKDVAFVLAERVRHVVR